MTVVAVVCLVLSALFQLASIALIVRQASAARAQLARWERANPMGHAEGSYGQAQLLNDLVRSLLGEKTTPYIAIGLIVGGVLLGLLGSLLTV